MTTQPFLRLHDRRLVALPGVPSCFSLCLLTPGSVQAQLLEFFDLTRITWPDFTMDNYGHDAAGNLIACINRTSVGFQ